MINKNHYKFHEGIDDFSSEIWRQEEADCTEEIIASNLESFVYLFSCVHVRKWISQQQYKTDYIDFDKLLAQKKSDSQWVEDEKAENIENRCHDTVYVIEDKEALCS